MSSTPLIEQHVAQALMNVGRYLPGKINPLPAGNRHEAVTDACSAQDRFHVRGGVALKTTLFHDQRTASHAKDDPCIEGWDEAELDRSEDQRDDRNEDDDVHRARTRYLERRDQITREQL
jgi:hypothetical protein